VRCTCLHCKQAQTGAGRQDLGRRGHNKKILVADFRESSKIHPQPVSIRFYHDGAQAPSKGEPAMNRKNRNIAEWAFYALIGGLLGYAASRTLDFVQNTLAADKQILGYLYLLATGIGAVIWLYVYLRYADGSKQRGISFVMGLADLIGEMILVYADTVRVASENGTMQMTSQEQSIFITASVGIIGLNILAGYIFKLSDPNAEAEAHARDMADEIREAAIKKMNTPAEKQRMANELAPILEAAMFEQVRQEIRTAAGQYGHAPIDNTIFDRRVESRTYLSAVPSAQVDPAQTARPGLWVPEDEYQELAKKHPSVPGTFTPTVPQVTPPFPFSQGTSRIINLLPNWLKPKAFRPNEQVIWTERENGKRERLFCMICFSQGREWTTAEPCEHVLNSEGQPIKVLSSPESANPS
jgi:hypothetical protein